MPLQIGIVAQCLRRIKINSQTHLIVASVYTRVTQTTDKNAQVECRPVAAFFESATAMHLARYKMMKRERHVTPAEWAGALALTSPARLYVEGAICSEAVYFHGPTHRIGYKSPGRSHRAQLAQQAPTGLRLAVPALAFTIRA